MIKLYVKLIKIGKITIEEVPVKWREMVREELEKENVTSSSISE